MLARSYSAGLHGVDGYVITVEADVRQGLPGLTLVGRAAGAVGEARERVRSALAHCGHELRPRRQIVNLAPADQRKESPGIDLAVACALLASHGIISAAELGKVMLWGELGLDGAVRSVAGTLVVADCARRHGFEAIAVPSVAAREAAMIPGLAVLPVGALPQLVAHLRGETLLPPWEGERGFDPTPDRGPDLSDVCGQALARQALEVMVAGGHNLLLHGPPGVGKTMLARRAARLFPDLRPEDALTVTKIHSLSRRQPPEVLARRPPVRMPHHTVSPAGLFGGGSPVRPGEVSLAHRGLLFLDELLEFPRACLEGLREPLEDGEVSIVRAASAVRFPARFQLMAALNPCPCGYLGHPERACTCSLPSIKRYQQRLSGPMLDRIDLVVPMSPASTGIAGEPTAAVRERIERARRVQQRRFAGTPWSSNAELPAEQDNMARYCALEPAAADLLEKLADHRRLSPRARHRLRRVARTLADLRREESEAAKPLGAAEIALAAQLRRPIEAA